MVKTPLDDDFSLDEVHLEGDAITVECALCHKPLIAHWHHLMGSWLHATVHNKCADGYDRKPGSSQAVDQPIPDRFAQFDPERADKEAVVACGAFSPESKLKVLAIIGVPARGKSRLMWATIQAFFGELERTTGAKRWCEYYLFADLVSELDRTVLAKAKMSRYCFIDDIGSTESYGRERAALQDVIHTRVKKQQWTFLTIDNVDFDARFEDLFRDRAVTVYLEK